MNASERDYTRKIRLAAAALVAVLAAVSFIPPRSIGGVKLRRANIFSDLFAFDDAPQAEEDETLPLFDEEEFRVDMEEVVQRIGADTSARSTAADYRWEVGGEGAAVRRMVPDTTEIRAAVCVEEFDTTGRYPFRAFCDTLLNARRPVRIAVLGDSFIEGDILTADLRERLQEFYGGGGPGFAPMASPLTAFRRTISTQSKGWTAYNIMQRKRAPEALREKFFVSGWVCQPSVGASTRWEMTGYRRRLDEATAARVVFLAPHDCRIELTVNDTLRREFSVAGAPGVQQIAVGASRIRSLGFRLLSGAEGFVGYGAFFEGDGVVVDNFSVRSNNGQAMFWTDPSVNARIDALGGYDLVILQYGLNIMQAGVKNYAHYARQIEKMIAFVRECFPGAAVLVMGVSDRSVRTDAGFEPMDAIPYMLASQREAAERSGAAFWSTCDAMRAEGGMECYVRNGWAGKDYTHINYAGGARVAQALYDAIRFETSRLPESRPRRVLHEEALLDSARRADLDRRILSGVAPVSPKVPRR